MSVSCRCGRNVFTLPCTSLQRNDYNIIIPPLCSTPCNKQKHCRKHKCAETCCSKEIHICEEKCNKTLKCGSHKCSYTCGHPEKCHSCMEGVSFDELACYCGRTKMFPPIPCGAKPPICNYPCTRERPCGHAMLGFHPCHFDTEPCPPCMVFVERSW